MKHYYSIGEAAKILGISVQTLRYYDSIALLHPKVVNEKTSYRYYTADQFHFLDRIRYLQRLGMSLEDIRDVIGSNDIAKLVNCLEKYRQIHEEEAARLLSIIEDVEWYQSYFTYMKSEDDSATLAQIKQLPTRYAVTVPVMGNSDRPDAHIRLMALRNTILKDFSYMRQYFLQLDYDSLLAGDIQPLRLGMYIKDALIKDEQVRNNPNIIEIPKGNYCCFRAKILADSWHPEDIARLMSPFQMNSKFVIANEYENNLQEYSLCPYEIQVLLA